MRWHLGRPGALLWGHCRVHGGEADGVVVGTQYKTVSPVGDRVLVKVDESEPSSAGGILLPTSAQRKPTQGSVHSLGDVKSLKVGCPLCRGGADGVPVTLQVAWALALLRQLAVSCDVLSQARPFKRSRRN